MTSTRKITNHSINKSKKTTAEDGKISHAHGFIESI
jgi:hypothetical protein